MRLIPRLLLAAGVLLAAGGVWLLVSDAPARDAARVAALPRLTPAAAANAAPGTTFLLEGRLVAAEPPGPRAFVAFHREAFLRVESSGASKGRQVWQRTATVRPRLAVEGAGAVAEVVKSDYVLVSPPHHEQTDVLPRYVSMVDTTERFLGFKAGDAVTVDGRAGANGAAGRAQIEASAIFGGSADAYLASVQSGTTTFKVVGGVFVVLGALLAIVAAVWLRVGARPASRARAE